MVNKMITTTCFSICGYFNYPIIKNSLLINIITKISDMAQNDINIELITVDKSKINHTLLFELGDYSSAYSTNLNLLESDKYTPLSICFKNKYNISTDILIKPVDYNGFEIICMLEEDELDICTNKDSIIQECARIFFETLKPLYGCCGTEMFIDEFEHIEENDIINTKFHYIGYVDFRIMEKFGFINNNQNTHKFVIKPLQDGNMYINKKLLNESN